MYDAGLQRYDWFSIGFEIWNPLEAGWSGRIA